MNETTKTLIQIIALHEQMKSSYFFKPPSIANCRRYYEDIHSLTSDFEYNGDNYRVEQLTQCSCSHVYYSVEYYKNGERIDKDIRFIKKILNELENSNTN